MRSFPALSLLCLLRIMERIHWEKNWDSACPLTCPRYQNKQVTAGFEPRTRASKPLALSLAQAPLWAVNQDLPRSLLGMGLTSLRCESPQRGLFVGESFGDPGRKKDSRESIWISKDNGVRLSRGNSGEGTEKPKISEKAGRYCM